MFKFTTRRVAAVRNWFCSLNNNEKGLEALQIVMIVAIAAVILLAATGMGEQVVNWARQQVEQLTGWSL